MAPNPYRIEPPFVLSFSGGRTSAYMLYHVLQAYGGKLPEDGYVIFANTGKECDQTLDFIHKCEQEWGVDVHWLEWTKEDPRYRRVTYETANRTGKPFEELIQWKQFLPNPVMRLCTQHLKIDCMKRYIQEVLELEEWNAVIGIRYDEPRRWRIMGQDSRNKREFKVGPLIQSKVNEGIVLDFWSKQPFNLDLKSYEGNCDVCFLKGMAKKDLIAREHPERLDWWIEQEKKAGKTFRASGPSYSDLKERAYRQLPLFVDIDESQPDCNCTD